MAINVTYTDQASSITSKSTGTVASTSTGSAASKATAPAAFTTTGGSATSATSFDAGIVGGGIVGLATALAILERTPDANVAVFEKEATVGSHQTGHNSGVIHSGIYYKPGSLKAKLCVEGVRLMARFCSEHGLPYERCGKVIVATDERELPALEELYRRGVANGVPGLTKIDAAEIKELEPEVRGIAGLHSPETAIVDYRRIAQAMADCVVKLGGTVLTGAPVRAIREVAGKSAGGGIELLTDKGRFYCRLLVNCAGLYSDKVAAMMGIDAPVKIVPFRGEYYFLRPGRETLVRGLVYPVPDPRFPFLGVHFTRTLDGRVEAGPNAVLALAREGYTKASVRPKEAWETLTYPGFLRMARRYWRVGAYEVYRSLSKRSFAKALQRLVPAVTIDALVPGGAGVRAQAVARDGSLVDDFRIETTPNSVHVLNAPSPGATSSLAIGRYVADIVQRVAGTLS